MNPPARFPVEVARVRWAEAYRVVNARYPPIDVFERIAPPEDWEALFDLEQRTNPRVRQEWGDISLVSPEERVTGPGAGWVMAAFTHVGRSSRFSDGSYGVYYAARTLLTSIAETAFHFGRFLAATREPPGTMLEMRTLVSTRVDHRFHDIRSGYRELHDPDDYGPPQAFARSLRASGSSGLVYRSVRHRGGQCVAVLRPRAIPKPSQGAHLRYRFDGHRIDRWFRIGDDGWNPIE